MAVDSAATGAGGRFALELGTITPPANASCVYAKDLTLDTSGAVSVSGSTAGGAVVAAAGQQHRRRPERLARAGAHHPGPGSL